MSLRAQRGNRELFEVSLMLVAYNIKLTKFLKFRKFLIGRF